MNLLGELGSLAPFGTALSQASKVVPVVAGPNASSARRGEAYVGFQRSAVALLAWADSMGPLQASAPVIWSAPVSVAGFVIPGWIAASDRQKRGAALVTSISGLLLADYLVRNIDYTHTVSRQIEVAWQQTTNLLGSLAELRLLGGALPTSEAETVVALAGELLSSIPVQQRDFIKRAAPDTARYEACQGAMAQALRRFAIEARRDLTRRSRVYGSRPARTRWYQKHRPRPITVPDIEIDVEKLVDAQRK